MTANHLDETFQFAPAERRALRATIAIDGPKGAGKTMTALLLARGLIGPDGKLGAIDTERQSMLLYADEIAGGFDCAQLSPPYHPHRFVAAIEASASAGHDALVIDSMSHAWSGAGGVLEIVDHIKRSESGKNNFTAWNEAGSLNDDLTNAILDFPGHVIVTMRSKMEYEMRKDEKTQRTTVERIGRKPVQRDEFEYEFGIVLSIDSAHQGTVTATRYRPIADLNIDLPGPKGNGAPTVELGTEIARWLESPEAVAPVAPRERSEDATLAMATLRALLKEGVDPNEMTMVAANVALLLDEPKPINPSEIGKVSDVALLQIMAHYKQQQQDAVAGANTPHLTEAELAAERMEEVKEARMDEAGAPE